MLTAFVMALKALGLLTNQHDDVRQELTAECFTVMGTQLARRITCLRNAACRSMHSQDMHV